MGDLPLKWGLAAGEESPCFGVYGRFLFLCVIEFHILFTQACRASLVRFWALMMGV